MTAGEHKKVPRIDISSAGDLLDLCQIKELNHKSKSTFKLPIYPLKLIMGCNVNLFYHFDVLSKHSLADCIVIDISAHGNKKIPNI